MAKKILNTDVDILGLLNLPLLNNETPLHVLTLNNDDNVVIRTLPEILSDIGVTGNYQLLSEKGQANGYAPLDSTGEIPSQYLPDIDTTETDPIFTASPARSITDTNINNWNEAFFWGDHALAGYVPETRTLSNGPGIYPIGNLSMSRTISLDFDYLDARYASGLLQREAALVASEDNITLSGLQTIDGIALSEGDRVLLLGQTNPSENGVYLASAGTWSRATDFDQPNFEEVSQGASIFVSSGVDLGGTGWTLQTENPITVGTTPLIFIQYAGTSNYVAGNLIDIVGNSINHGAGTWSNKSNLSGATVISNLAVDAYGHLTNWTTRTLTPASIGAEPSFSKNTAFNKNFGTSAGTILEGDWRPSWGQITDKPSTFPPSSHSHTFASITNKPTTLSGYGITDAYTKSESDGRYVNLTGNESINGIKTFNNNIALGQFSNIVSTSNPNLRILSEGSISIEMDTNENSNSTFQVIGGDYTGTYNTYFRIQESGDSWIFPDGNFGIGTSTPSEKLAVLGNISASGSISVSGGNSNRWNQAYGWGDHANANYARLGNTSYNSDNYLHLSRQGTSLGNGVLYVNNYGTDGILARFLNGTNSTDTNASNYVEIDLGANIYATGDITSKGVIKSDSGMIEAFNTKIRDNNSNALVISQNTSNSGGGNIYLRPAGDTTTSNQLLLSESTGATFFGNVTASNLSGTNTGDQTLSGLGGVPTSRTITAGSGLTGGGNLSSNRTLSVDSTVARTNTSETFSSTVTATNFILSSDRRLKENIESLGNGYYTFNFKDDETKRKRYGAMADEVKEYAPELIYENEEGYEQVGYIDFLIKKIAELENKINSL